MSMTNDIALKYIEGILQQLRSNSAKRVVDGIKKPRVEVEIEAGGPSSDEPSDDELSMLLDESSMPPSEDMGDGEMTEGESDDEEIKKKLMG